ncbi:MAG: hypothetical protein KDC76_02640 [Bacteroidetes bacterium]|nr:hypothetical protein [Bacteroidota bacterium]
MESHKILILCGYDYTPALLEHAADQTIFLLITKDNLKYFDPSNIEELQKRYGNRMVLSSNSNQDIRTLINGHHIQSLLTFGWRKLIDVELYTDLENLINIHPALLPEYKGYHPVPYVILNHEQYHGITAHRITPEMDGGAIILRKILNTNTFTTLQSLQYMANKAMPEVLKSVINLIQSNSIMEVENDDSKTIVRAPRRTPEDSEVPADTPLKEVFDQVRAADSERFPAFFMINGEKVYIRMSREESANRETPFDI